MATYLVTGGAGYVGTAIVQELARRGERVRSFDLRVDPTLPGSVEQVVGDIRSGAAVAAACDGVDVVLHNVAQVPLAHDAQLFESVNVGGTETMLRAAAAAGVAKVVATSSSAVYGIPAVNPVVETSAPAPIEQYGWAKLRGEWLCRAAVSRGQDVTIVRPRTVVGPGRLGIFGILFDWIADGVDVPVFDEGAGRYQFLHHDDLVEGILLAAARPGPDEFNLGADDVATMRETLQALCRTAGTGAKVRSVPSSAVRPLVTAMSRLRWTPLVEYQLRLYSESLWFDCAHARDVLGWRPRHSGEAAMAEAYQWFLAHRGDEPEGGGLHRRSARQGVLAAAKRAMALAPGPR